MTKDRSLDFIKACVHLRTHTVSRVSITYCGWLNVPLVIVVIVQPFLLLSSCGTKCNTCFLWITWFQTVPFLREAWVWREEVRSFLILIKSIICVTSCVDGRSLELPSDISSLMQRRKSRSGLGVFTYEDDDGQSSTSIRRRSGDNVALTPSSVK